MMMFRPAVFTLCMAAAAAFAPTNQQCAFGIQRRSATVQLQSSVAESPPTSDSATAPAEKLRYVFSCVLGVHSKPLPDKFLTLSLLTIISLLQ